MRDLIRRYRRRLERRPPCFGGSTDGFGGSTDGDGVGGDDANGIIDLNVSYMLPWEEGSVLASNLLLHVATHSSFVSDVSGQNPPRLADLRDFPRVDLEDFLRPGICILDKF